MDVENTIQVRSFRFDLAEALNTVLKTCGENPTVAHFCQRILALDVRVPSSRFQFAFHNSCYSLKTGG